MSNTVRVLNLPEQTPLPTQTPSNNPTLTTQIVTRLQSNDNDWTNKATTTSSVDFSSPMTLSLSLPSLYKITRDLGTTAKTLKFFDYVRTHSPSPPDPPSLSSAFQAIFEIASHSRSTDVHNVLLDFLLRAGLVDDAFQMLDEMIVLETGYPLNENTMDIVIASLLWRDRSGRRVSEEEIVELVSKFGVFSRLSEAYPVDHQAFAMEFFYEMQGKGLEGNAVTCTALISSFCNANNIDKAMQLFNEISKVECSPDAIVYYTLIADKAFEMLTEMERAGVKPDGVTYSTLISYFRKTGDFTTANGVMRKMISEGLVPTVVTYGALIHVYCLVGNLDEAMGIYRDMSSGSRVPLNTVIYNILIDSLCKNGKVEIALSLMDAMKDNGVRPNTTTFNAMLKGLQEINWLEKAFELMNQMTEQACNPDYVHHGPWYVVSPSSSYESIQHSSLLGTY
ncbi:hypothetical protein Acr_08g0008830 [Actinidia rufa]|uniref:Tetratricopeptide repeat (TPR)-like superfamily protein n=1 Tax=Actinidia rufa TaxID=165716 RepID=A0A7J0F3K9_9ERIC|nr:hypothetical protein Acr_08g0008830 [Actinidia rufa]